MQIKALKANNGDSFLLSFKDESDITRNILIDGGTQNTYYNSTENKYGDLKTVIDSIKAKNQKIDLLVLTHIDEDHIGGILAWFKYDRDAHKLIDEIWFNSAKVIASEFGQIENNDLNVSIDRSKSYKTSISQGIEFETYIEMNKIWSRELIYQGEKVRCGIKFEILSPNITMMKNLVKEYRKKKINYFTEAKANDHQVPLRQLVQNEDKISLNLEEDQSLTNGSSIAFILTYRSKKYLFLGDAHAKVVHRALADLGYSKDNRLKVNILKLSHHGSKKSTTTALLSLIEADNYLISSNGEKHGHPDKITLARIIKTNPNSVIYFNYENIIKSLILPEDHKEFPGFKAKYVNDYL